MANDLRRHPSEQGYAEMGMGLLVPAAIAEAEGVRSITEGYGQGDEDMRLNSAVELHEPEALAEAAQQVYQNHLPELRAIEEATRKAWALQLEAAMAQGDDDAVRSMSEASGDWRLEFDSPYNRTSGYEQLGLPGTFSLLREWNIWERLAILERCHMAYERNPLANTAVGLTTLFVVGKGLNLTFDNPDVKAVVEDFMNDPENDFEIAQTELCNQLQIDGEIFIRFFTENGRTLIASIQPWYVKWIIADPNFRKRVLSYKVIGTFFDGFSQNVVVNEDWTPDEVLHVKINCANYETRGRPELFRILPWLKAYKDWLEERARVNRRQGSVYYHMQLKNATPGQVSAMRSAYRQPPPPASIFVTNDNVTLSALSGNVRASDAAEDGRAMKLMALAGVDMPEYMFGEGAHSTKATASTQELPALAKFAHFQKLLISKLFKPILRRVIQNAVEAGVLGEVVPKSDTRGEPVMDKATGQPAMVRAVEAFDCSFPDLQEPDPLNLAQALQIHEASGWASKETVSGKAGYDYPAEEAKLQDEQARTAVQAYNAASTSGVSGPPHDAMPISGPSHNLPSTGPATPTQEAEDDVKAADVLNIFVEGMKFQREQNAPVATLPAPATHETHVHLDKLVMDVPATLAEAMKQPAAQITVQPANVSVSVPEAKPLDMTPMTEAIKGAMDGIADAIKHQPAPQVNVAAPAIPQAQVQVVENAPRSTVFRLIKDKDGDTVGVEKVEG